MVALGWPGGARAAGGEHPHDRPLRVVLPAMLDSWVRHWTLMLRHLPLVLALAGVPLFAIALADPATPLSRREVTRPGRRISLMIDGSSSMLAPFAARSLTTKDAPMEATFFASVAVRRALRPAAHGRRTLPRPRRASSSLATPPTSSPRSPPTTTTCLLSLPAHRRPGRVGERFRDGGHAPSPQQDAQGTKLFRAVRLPRRLRQPDGDLQRRRATPSSPTRGRSRSTNVLATARRSRRRCRST